MAVSVCNLVSFNMQINQYCSASNLFAPITRK